MAGPWKDLITALPRAVTKGADNIGARAQAKIDASKVGSVTHKVATSTKDMAGAISRNPNKTILAVIGGAALIEGGIDAFDEDLIPPVGDKTIQAKFPSDDSSGQFWTEMSFYTWKNVGGHERSDGVNTQTGSEKTNFLGIVQIPMPTQLATAYAGKFSEGDDMVYNRDGSGWSSFDKASSLLAGGAVEAKKAFNSMLNINNTAKMSLNSVNNNNMGMIYEGGNLRSHSFSWRFQAKSEGEWEEIKNVIKTLKILSTPANTGFGATEILGLLSDEKRNKEFGLNKETKDHMLGGRLTIPPTCTVRFLDGDKLNPHLFKVKDSFITNLEVNYTSQGNWQAHPDGAPPEVQLTLTLKEISMVTIMDVGQGY